MPTLLLTLAVSSSQSVRYRYPPVVPIAVASMSSSSNVRLHPWRDGVDHCLRLLEPSRSGGSCQSNKDVVTSIQRGVYTHASASSNNPTIRSVDICFHPQDYQVGSSGKLPLLELFQAIQKLPNLESLIVRFTRTEATAWHLTRQAIPPVPALTAVLVSGSPDDEDFDDAAAGRVPLNKKMGNGNSRLAYLTCIGLPLFADDYDMNGFTELLRIHPSLTSIVIKDCLFAKRAHLEQLERVLAATTTPPKRKRHVELLSNTVVDTSKLPSSDGGARSWWSYLLCGCCM